MLHVPGDVSRVRSLFRGTSNTFCSLPLLCPSSEQAQTAINANTTVAATEVARECTDAEYSMPRLQHY